jgi:plasmid maintenance system antidote protein VapI
MAAIIEKQGSTLSNAANHIKLTKHRINKLNKEKEQMA